MKLTFANPPNVTNLPNVADPPSVAKPEKGLQLGYCGNIAGAVAASIVEMSGGIEHKVSTFLFIPGFHPFNILLNLFRL